MSGKVDLEKQSWNVSMTHVGLMLTTSLSPVPREIGSMKAPTRAMTVQPAAALPFEMKASRHRHLG